MSERGNGRSEAQLRISFSKRDTNNGAEHVHSIMEKRILRPSCLGLPVFPAVCVEARTGADKAYTTKVSMRSGVPRPRHLSFEPTPASYEGAAHCWFRLVLSAHLLYARVVRIRTLARHVLRTKAQHGLCEPAVISEWVLIPIRRELAQ